MGIFGWDLPPGCSFSDLPGNQQEFCEVCGLDIDNCICPTCPVCGWIGNSYCYKEHGLVLSLEQKLSKLEADAAIEDMNRIDAEYGNDLDEGTV